MRIIAEDGQILSDEAVVKREYIGYEQTAAAAYQHLSYDYNCCQGSNGPSYAYEVSAYSSYYPPAYETPLIKVEQPSDCQWASASYMEIQSVDSDTTGAGSAAAPISPEHERIISELLSGGDPSGDESIFLPVVKQVEDWSGFGGQECGQECGKCGKCGGVFSDNGEDAMPTPPHEQPGFSHSPTNARPVSDGATADLGLDPSTRFQAFLHEGQLSIESIMSHPGMPHSPPSEPRSPTAHSETPTPSPNTGGHYLMPPSLPPAYSPPDTVPPLLKTTYSNEGLAGSQRGVGAQMARLAPSGSSLDVKFPKKTGTPLLWQFLLNLLETDLGAGIINWINRSSLEFKITEPIEVAKRWGKIKNRPAMNYEKLSRSLRGYYLKGIMEKVVGEQYAYRFKCHPDVLCMALGARDASTGQPLI
eukprot:m.309195 g.309195  ORF g.309195 m.309195 type:complete len:418 (+) comp45756_c0_seq1:408-1661(+)